MAEFRILSREELKEELLILKAEILQEIVKILESQNHSTNDFLTTEEVMEKFKIKSANTIKKYLTPTKFGHKNLYSFSEIQKLIKNDNLKNR